MPPEFDDSTLSGELSLHIGGAGVQDCLFAVLLDVGLPAISAPSYSLDAASVVVVQGAGGTSEVGHSVVQPLSIDVVNLGGGLLPMMEEPCESMGEDLLTSEGDVSVSVLGDSTSLTADDGIPVDLFDPSESARRGAVFKVLTGFPWDNGVSHSVSPHVVVRGVVVGATTTPIIYR
jgi:hypothetical protein